ncbi:MAG TPA: TIGR04282 family arsenosugar biosynthesis glycosyltransferase [Gemmataceae bacterium]|nr:TIGR04282 family arsenosugar biosynthesis glycosyltransferase [Gemmataceae bacterium]
MSAQPVLLVFVKYPEPGKVKTRLASELGAETAASLYRDWVGMVLRAVQPVRPEVRVVGYFDGAPAGRFAEWDQYVDLWLEQPGGALGFRLAAAFDWAYDRGHPLLAIGTDCLDLNAGHVISAVNFLRDHEAVFGPATDGGYYLVGTRRHIPGFFEGVRWSSPHTLADQLARAHDLGCEYVLLPTLADIDTAADWRAYRERHCGTP